MVVVASVLLVALWGNARAKSAPLTREGQPLRVGIVQPNVPEEEREAPGRGPDILQRELSLIRQVALEKPGLIVLPESSLPPLEEYPDVARVVRQAASDAAAPMLLGSDQYEWHVANGRRQVDRSFNAAFMLRADGTTAAVYRKMHLVPWGEYVPLRRWLTFVGPLVQAIGSGFDAGDTMTLPPVGQHRSAAICYEIYPEMVRQSSSRQNC